MIEEGRFKANEQVELYERRAKCSSAPLANVALLHGYGDHCSRYEWVMTTFRDAGINVYAYDQRGHGRSPGKRAYIHRFEDFLDDLDAFLEHIAPDLGDVPLFLMGHSMGGMALARYAQTRETPARGLIFSSPFLAFSDETPAFLIALGPYVAKILPWLPVGAVDNTGLSRDPAVVEATNRDPLAFHGKVAAQTGAEFYRMIRAIEADMPKINTSMLIVHGTHDRVVSPGGSETLHAKAGASDKTLRMHEGGYHELYNDLDKEQFMAEIITWIKARV
ncbi:MAG TPA: alpha/beta hydrolase [Candidatus Hydrogenedentes bacterium]|nr:alpha/beta hydrolase [Candidatus Hydrogenedentota bacterium]